ncbi:hypothetical protein BC833DRAFT_611310 [Globomyces pollinis-pini]|nr:hypothetical protein BC833DRAFT_611310 [Globomyces pollinis-pini]
MGVTYRIIQPHTSQSDWQPQMTPALWGVVSGQNNDHHHHQDPCGQPPYGQQPQQPPYGQPPQQPHQPPYGQPPAGSNPPPYNQGNPNQGYPTQENHHHNNVSTGIQTAGILGTGAALLAGGLGAAALVGGVSYMAFKKNEDHHKHHVNQKAWEEDARRRTETYYSNLNAGRPVPPVEWVLTSSNNIPQNAIQTGNEKNGLPLYSARAIYENGVHIGKVSPTMKGGMELGWGCKARVIKEYEILVGNPNAVRWIDGRGKLMAQNHNFQGTYLVPGGNNKEYPLYVGRTMYEGGVHPGKVGPDCNGCYIAYGTKEIEVPAYQVLVFV